MIYFILVKHNLLYFFKGILTIDYPYMHNRVVQKCIAKIFLMLDANDPPKSFRNSTKVVTYFFSKI